MARYDTVLHCTIPYYIYYTTLNCTISYNCTILHHNCYTILYTILYYTILPQYTLQYYSIPYYPILCCITLYYCNLCYARLNYPGRSDLYKFARPWRREGKCEVLMDRMLSPICVFIMRENLSFTQHNMNCRLDPFNSIVRAAQL